MQCIGKQFGAISGRCLLILLLAMSVPRAVAVEDDSKLTDAKMDRLIEILEPNPHERWRKVPWEISLLQGQKLAVERRKPIFIWAMDGHPLGCT